MRRLNKEFIRFLIVGFTAFLIDFIILNVLVYIFEFTYELFNFVLVANLISSAISLPFGFYYQRKVTFKDGSSEKTGRKFTMFISLQLTNTIVYNVFIFNALINFLSVPIPISKVIVVGCMAVTSYLVMKYLIFIKTPADDLLRDTKT